MTKKDYELIAGVIRDSVDGQKRGSHRIVSEPNTIIQNIVWGLIEKLERENSKFNREKFLEACGVEEEKKWWLDNTSPRPPQLD